MAAVAAVASHERACALARAHGEVGWTARLVPLTVDGLTYASSVVVLDAARRKIPLPARARWLLGLGIAATLTANVAPGLGRGLADGLWRSSECLAGLSYVTVASALQHAPIRDRGGAR